MVEIVISLFKKLFIDHWQRKLISFLLAIIIWFVIHHSITTSKTLSNIPIRIVNLPVGKTVEGMLDNGRLNQKINLNVQGNKEILDELSTKDLEVIIDASGQPNQWIANISKKNIFCTDPKIDLTKAIDHITSQELIIKQTKLITEKIPVIITQPTGESPRGYQFLDIWPYQLSVTVNGPEEIVKKIKNRGLKLTFNLSEISHSELDAIQAENNSDEISFLVPDSWKKINIPQLSDTPFLIDDISAKSLRIDFSRQDFLPIGFSIPITIFFPPKFSQTLNPDTYSISSNDFIVKKNGIKVIGETLYAQGISRLFLDIVKDMIQIVVIAAPKTERENLLWSAQFIYPHELENRYVAKVLANSNDESHGIAPHMREEYLRNRFRSYMNRFRFYTASHQKLNLRIELQANTISVVADNAR